MRGLLHVTGEVHIPKYGTAHRSNPDGAIGKLKFVHNLGYQAMYDAMRTSRTVVVLHIHQRFRTRKHFCHYLTPPNTLTHSELISSGVGTIPPIRPWK